MIEDSLASTAITRRDPNRILLGLAASGRLLEADAILANEENPCKAKPFPLGYSHKRLIDEISKRKAVDRKDAIIDVLVLICVLLAWGALGFWFAMIPAITFYCVANLLRQRRDNHIYRDRFSQDQFPQTEDVFEDHRETNLVVFSGGNPFTNFGLPVGEWHLNADIKREKTAANSALAQASPVEPDIDEVYSRVLTSLKTTTEIDLEVFTLYLIQGQDVPEVIKPKGAHPIPTWHEPKELDEISYRLDASVRKYVCVSRSIWKHNVVASYFLSVRKIGEDICLDIFSILMPPLAEQYQRFDDDLPETFGGNVMAVIGNLIWAPLRPINAVLVLCSGLFRARDLKRLKRQVKNNPRFDFGAPNGIRMVASTFGAMDYYQNADRRTVDSVFVGRILRTFLDYLDECAVDTSELREQRTTIINQGLIVQSGDVNANSIAVGANAKAQGKIRRFERISSRTSPSSRV